MSASTMQPLLNAVRRRLWLGRFIIAVRLASWGTSALMLLAATAHLAIQPVSAGAVLSFLAVLWTALMAWAGWRRPSDSTCALWADRHLGGESAYGTLLDMGQRTQAIPNELALRGFEAWVIARMPRSLRLLAGRQDSAHLSRSLLSMLVCTAFSTLVLTLPGLAPSPRPEHAASPSSHLADLTMQDAEPPVAPSIVSELANALRSAPPSRASSLREAGRAAAGTSMRDDGTESSMVQPTGALPGGQVTGKKPVPGTAADAPPTPGAMQASAAGSGRDAGDSRDNRATAGVSQFLQSGIPLPTRESSARRPSLERRSDMNQLATFEEDPSTHQKAMARAGSVALAATPPPATEFMRLTPTEAAYVQAWMKARGRQR